MILVKSVYEARSSDDGYRILIEPEWPPGAPRGKRAGCDWMKSLGPSSNLRGWMRRNPLKASGFRDRYLAELGHNERDVDRVAKLLKQYGAITILQVPTDDKWEIAETLASYLHARCDVG